MLDLFSPRQFPPFPQDPPDPPLVLLPDIVDEDVQLGDGLDRPSLRTDAEPVVDPRDPAEVGTEPGQEHVVEVEEGEEERRPVQAPEDREGHDVAGTAEVRREHPAAEHVPRAEGPEVAVVVLLARLFSQGRGLAVPAEGNRGLTIVQTKQTISVTGTI